MKNGITWYNPLGFCRESNKGRGPWYFVLLLPPIAMTGLRSYNPVKAWVTFGVVCVASAAGLVFTAIDFNKFGLISYGAYFIAGGSVLTVIKDMRVVYSTEFIILLITGGVNYTAGMIPFVLEMRHKRYGHALFHIFILLGSIFQFAGIFKYCIL